MKKIQLKKAVLLAALCAMMAIDARAQGSTPYVSPYGLRELIDGYYETKTGYTGTFLKYTDNNTLGKPRRVNAIDTLSIGMLDGHHWGGKELTIGEDMNNVYFVNKKTGEYLVLGGSWGNSPMQDYTGTLFNLKAGQYCRADDWGKPGGNQAAFQVEGVDPVLGDKAARNGKGYLISLAHDEETVIGRIQTSSGAQGTFEYSPYLMDRYKTRKEYVQHINDGYKTPARGNSDGKFIFYFHPVEKDGKQYYIIYTHRQTTGPAHQAFYNGLSESDALMWEKIPEYGNRDSYLCLKSTPSEKADYNLVSYKKFAGKMFNIGTNDKKYFFEGFSSYSNDNEPRAASWTRNDVSLLESFQWAMGPDEEAYYMSVYTEEGFVANTLDNRLPLSTGLSNVSNEDECLWKIVTLEERDKYPIAANIDNPVDVSYKIKNHKFYPNYKPYETGGVDDAAPNYEWQWADDATASGTISHIHPYSDGVGTEFHKIGTHHYDRWGWGETTSGTNNSFLKAKSDERMMTQGEESNYVASIYNGTAALRQEIKGLRPGRYIVYCRAFYAPFDMKKFDNKDISGSFLDEKNSTPTYNGAAIDATTQAVIDAQPLSDKSYFFAVGKDDAVRKRDLPSIFCGMMPVDESHLDKISKSELIAYDFYDEETGYWYRYSQKFLYTPLGEQIFADSYYDDNDELVNVHWNNQVGVIKGHTNREGYDLLRDSTVFAMVTYNNQNYFVPRNLAGAARFFTANDRTKYENAFNYRIGLPVEVGDDGKLVIGVEHEATANQEEWVCFDNFELVYYGDQNHWEFIVDESEPENNTRYHDLFDWETSTQANYRSTTMVIKRGLDPEKYVPIVLPANLTKKQVKEAFGDDVKISTPSHITYKTIHFAAVSTSGADNDVCMNAYQPYIVKPSIPAQIGTGEKWTRTRFVGENPFGWTAEQWSAYKDDETKRERIYIPKVGRNNRYTGDNVQDKNRREMKGPIYFVDSVLIEKATHYTSHKEDTKDSKKPYYDAYYNASNQWPALPTFVPTQQRRVKIKGSTDGKEYELQAVPYYDPLGTNGVPPYSYFMSGGNLKFNGAGGSSQSKGFSFYLRIMEYDKSGSAKVFMGNVADFIWEEVPEVTGVTETEAAEANPANDLYYDLQGRAVGSYPSKPGIYIYRGKKIAVK